MTIDELYKRYVEYMARNFGPMQGNPPTYPIDYFVELLETNPLFYKKFGGETIPED